MAERKEYDRRKQPRKKPSKLLEGNVDINYKNVNELPNGYYGVFWAAMFPFIWRKWIDPLIKK